jgi:hypothetical protein
LFEFYGQHVEATAFAPTSSTPARHNQRRNAS